MKSLRSALIIGVLLVSCGDGTDVFTPPSRDEPSSGEVVGSMEVGETQFVMRDEGNGCLAVEIVHPGLQVTVKRSCFEGVQVLAPTDTCGWSDSGVKLEAAAEAAPYVYDCDIVLPRAVYGYVGSPGIGHVCVGIIDPSLADVGVVGARFVDVDEAGFILDEAQTNDVAVAHLFTSGGLRFGQPPLDAPSDPIYRFCEAQAPWGDAEPEHNIWIDVSLDESLRTDDLIFGFDAGTGFEAVSGGAFEDEPSVRLPLRVPASERSLNVWMRRASTKGLEHVFDHRYPWPDELLDLLEAAESCNGTSRLVLHIDSAISDGAQDAVVIEWDGSDCG